MSRCGADSPLAFGFTTLRVNALLAPGSFSRGPTCHRSSAWHEGLVPLPVSGFVLQGTSPVAFQLSDGWGTSPAAFRPLVGSNPPVVSGFALGTAPPAQAICAFTTKSVNAVYSSIRPKWGVGLLTKKELAENGGTHGKPTAARANRTGRFHVFLLILQAPSSICQPFP